MSLQTIIRFFRLLLVNYRCGLEEFTAYLDLLPALGLKEDLELRSVLGLGQRKVF
jgi:hypothetical protein